MTIEELKESLSKHLKQYKPAQYAHLFPKTTAHTLGWLRNQTQRTSVEVVIKAILDGKGTVDIVVTMPPITPTPDRALEREKKRMEAGAVLHRSHGGKWYMKPIGMKKPYLIKTPLACQLVELPEMHPHGDGNSIYTWRPCDI